MVMIILDPALVVSAQQGSRQALEALVRSLERPVYNLSIRMLGAPPDAEDASQEILIKIITHLGDVRDPNAAGAWAFRVACRHLVHERRKSRLDAQRLTFRAFAADLAEGAEDLPDAAARDPETQAMIEEVKIGCTLALLTCLTRPLRAAYVLGEIFELSDAEAAAALDIDAAAYRQRLRRARALITAFMQARCGIVSPEAACRCERRLAPAMRLGRVAIDKRPFEGGAPSTPRLSDICAKVAELAHGRAAAAVMRSNPNFSTTVGALVLKALRV